MKSQALLHRIREVQEALIAGADDALGTAELEHLRAIVRLTFEFNDVLAEQRRDRGALSYAAGSTFAGLESYSLLVAAYRCLADAPPSALSVDLVSKNSLAEQFRALFGTLSLDAGFLLQFRLFLDLFKLQLIFFALVYE